MPPGQGKQGARTGGRGRYISSKNMLSKKCRSFLLAGINHVNNGDE